MGGRVRTGRPIIERTRGLPSAPRLKPTRRHTQEPEDRSQRDTRVCPVHGAQDSQRGVSVRQTLT